MSSSSGSPSSICSRLPSLLSRLSSGEPSLASQPGTPEAAADACAHMQSSSGSPVEGAQVPAPARNGHQPERGERACAECRSEQHMNGWAGKTLQLDVPQPNGPCPKENGSAGPAQQGKGGSDLVPNGHAHAEGAANKCSEAVETPSPPARAHRPH